MRILKQIIAFFIFSGTITDMLIAIESKMCYIPSCHSSSSAKKTDIKKSINIETSEKYKVNSFTNINIEANETQKTAKKQKQNLAKPKLEKQTITEQIKEIKEPKKDYHQQLLDLQKFRYEAMSFKENPSKNADKKENEDYYKQLLYLQGLRYEVMSLKSQLGDRETMSIPYGDYIDKKTSAQRFNALTQSYNDALKKSGFFVGVSFGVLDIYTSGYKDSQFLMTRITPVVFGGSGGYQKFFNHYLGTRLYGGFFTSFFHDIYTYDINNGGSQVVQNPNGTGNLQSFYMLAFMSADLLFEFPLDSKFKHYVGGFMGLNIGIMYYRPYEERNSKGSYFPYLEYYPVSFLWNYNLQVDYSFNLGVSLTLYNVNRFELGLGIPFAYLSLPGFSETANPLETTTTSFWRSAVMLFNYRLLLKF